MKSASVKQFVALRAALLNEKAHLEARLKEIQSALGGTPSVSATPTKPSTSSLPPKKKRGARLANTMSLHEAVNKAVTAKPLTKAEILKAIDALGYKFSASNPMMSLNTLVYTPGKLKKHPGGKWGPLKK
jgi:hypothetical protein